MLKSKIWSVYTEPNKSIIVGTVTNGPTYWLLIYDMFTVERHQKPG